MELWNGTSELVQIVFNILIAILPVLAGVAVTSVTGAAMVNAIKRLYKEIVRPAIDEPGDLIIGVLAKRLGKDPAWISRMLVENLDAVIAVLPEEAIPTVETK